MKLLLLLALFAVAVVCVRCEVCTTNSDCTTTTCSSGYTIVCQHPAGAGIVTDGGLCTCAVVDLTCATQADCVAHSYPCISDGHKHCYDGQCICSRW